MLFGDLKDMLMGLKTKIFYKTFKKLTDWDENFLKFIQCLLDNCIDLATTASNENNVQCAFRAYINVQNQLASAVNEVKFDI